MKFQYEVFYCDECGLISDTAKYISQVSEWGTVVAGRHGTDYESRDSETQDTDIKCENCDHMIREGSIDYGDALKDKFGDHDLDDDEQEDYDELFGEQEPPEPPEPREGRNTLKVE